MRLDEKGLILIGIVIVAHGGLADEYLSAMEHVVGKMKGVKAISIRTSDNRSEKQREISQAVNDVDAGDGVVVVVDMFGGTPSNLAVAACQSGNRQVLYGANLPMLVKLAKARHLSVDDSVRSARDAGRKYLDSMRPTRTEKNQ